MPADAVSQYSVATLAGSWRLAGMTRQMSGAGCANMKILFCSVPFRPSIGGIETVSELLAERFQRAGHEVVLVTRTPSAELDRAPYRIARHPGAAELFRLVQWSDLVFHNNISLRFAWPQLMLRRPWVVAHHTWIPFDGAAGRVKRWVLSRATNLAASDALAASLPVACEVVPNPYADDRFHGAAAGVRDRQLVFVGRLVSDKGVDVLVRALGLLARRGRRVGLSVVGEGPEMPALEALALELGVADRIDFMGRRTGDELAQILRRHQVMVVPSVWQEPFGVVCLEAMACGCVPVAARSGGLPDAVGRAGVVVERADPRALAHALEELVDNEALLQRYRDLAPAHLARHTRERVSEAYLQVLERAHGRALLPGASAA